MFEHFTEQARHVVVRAQEEARELGHESIGIEHLVLGLARLESGIVPEVFVEFDITSDTVRKRVRERLGPGSEKATEGFMPFSESAKRVMQRSLSEVLSSGHRSVGPEHLLLAVATVARVDDDAGGILSAVGVDPDRLRQAVLQRLPPPVVSGAGRPDELLQALLEVSAGIARTEQRERFGLEDMLLACLGDAHASRLLIALGVDLNLLRQRLRGDPPAA
jgi:ATP-dependent Clp protease ATP-binding subunit ClpA